MVIDVVGTIEVLAALAMPVGLAGIFWHRIKTAKGTGARTVQLVVAVLIVPAILILSLEGRLHSEAVSALLGAVIGYVLSGVGMFQPKQRGGKSQAKTPSATP